MSLVQWALASRKRQIDEESGLNRPVAFRRDPLHADGMARHQTSLIATVLAFRVGGAPMRVVRLALMPAAVVSIATGSAAAANHTQETLDRYLRIDDSVGSQDSHLATRG